MNIAFSCGLPQSENNGKSENNAVFSLNRKHHFCDLNIRTFRDEENRQYNVWAQIQRCLGGGHRNSNHGAEKAVESKVLDSKRCPRRVVSLSLLRLFPHKHSTELSTPSNYEFVQRSNARQSNGIKDALWPPFSICPFCQHIENAKHFFLSDK